MKKVFLTGASGFIGTNLIVELKERNVEVLNFDSNPPTRPQDQDVWTQGDIMDERCLETELQSFAPDVVIHLAARTDCVEDTTVEQSYRANTVGTSNLLAAVNSCRSVERLIVTSSQYVCGPGRQPANDQDYFPHTVYGQSKVETEERTRAAELNCVWTLIRPVNIWGPYHARYSDEFWKVAAKGWYVHPDVPAPTRTYGYVGNVIWQILGILEAPEDKVNGNVFYVGDQPVKIDQWSIGFCRALRGKDPPRIPLWIMKGIAMVGDAISFVIRRPFLITSSRLRSMTVDYLSPIDKTVSLLGEAPISLGDGIEETARWFKNR